MSDTNNELTTNYPEQVVCTVLPALEETVANVEITDWDDNKVMAEVPSAAVTRLNMPRLSNDLPPQVRDVFETSVGLGLLVCRVLNRNEDVVSIDVPATTGPMTVVVPFKQLARKVIVGKDKSS